jgi:hypothetical protein
MGFQVKLLKRTSLIITLAHGESIKLTPAAPLSKMLADVHLEDSQLLYMRQRGLIKFINSPEVSVKQSKQNITVATGAGVVTGAEGHPTMIRKPADKEKGEEKR